MSNQVLRLPARVAPSRLEHETALIGALLFLTPPVEQLRAVGFSGEEFTVELFVKVWKHVLRQREAGATVTVETVVLAALARKAITVEEGNELRRLAGINQLDLTGFRTVARDFRLLVQRERTATSLREELQRLEGREEKLKLLDLDLEGHHAGRSKR